jgi:hypothetical protein
MPDRTQPRPRRTRRPSGATLIACTALFLALGGTSVAATVLSGSSLKNGSVTRAKIAAGAIDSKRLASNAVAKGKIAGGAVTQGAIANGAVGPGQLAAGSVTSAALASGSVTGPALASGAVSWKTLGAQVVSSAATTIPVNQFATVTAACPSGSVAVSGGESFGDPSTQFVIQSGPSSASGAPTGWSATGGNPSTTAAGTMTVFAVCISAGS